MIREASEKDLKEINIMFKTYFDNEITKDIFTKIMIFEHKKILGFISYSIIYDRCELNYIAVLEEYRQNKIASKLMDYMVNDAKELDNISLEVNVNNVKAINLYKKYSFKIEAIRKNYYHNADAYLMVRKK